MTENKNDQGFEVRRDGKVFVTTTKSALSGKLLGQGAVTAPVPSMQGVFYKLTPDEALALTEYQLALIVEKAARLFAEPKRSKPTRKSEDKEK